MTRKFKIKKNKDHGFTEKDYDRIRENCKDPVYMQHAINKTAEKIIDEVGMFNIGKIMDENDKISE